MRCYCEGTYKISVGHIWVKTLIYQHYNSCSQLESNIALLMCGQYLGLDSEIQPRSSAGITNDNTVHAVADM